MTPIEIRHPAAPPIALTIAGSDNSAGAGIQADLKAFGALGVYGLTAVTCVVAEAPGIVSVIQPIEPKIVREQIRLSFEAYPVAAVKTGMLFSREIIEAVSEELESKRPVQLVIDPVMVATSGTALLDEPALQAATQRLFTLATLITPNLDEAGKLLGRNIQNLSDMRLAGAELVERFGTSFLIKGGHLKSGEAIDLLFTRGKIFEFAAARVAKVKTHGTGCTYSAAITAGLAKGQTLELAVGEAKQFITEAIRNYLHWDHGRAGKGTDALNPLGF